MPVVLSARSDRFLEGTVALMPPCSLPVMLDCVMAEAVFSMRPRKLGSVLSFCLSVHLDAALEMQGGWET